MKRWLRVGLGLCGLGLFGWLVARCGIEDVIGQFRRLGWWTPLVFLPYALVYCVDTLGWRLAFDPGLGRLPGFWKMFRVRWAGESMNLLVPTAYIGGEAVKVELLAQEGVARGYAAAAGVTSKTCQVVAQVVFTGLGGLAAWVHLPPGGGVRLAMGAVTVGAFLFVLGLIWIQRRGLFEGLRRASQVLHIGSGWFVRHAGRLRSLDDQIAGFYARSPGRFGRCTMVYLAGWLADALELYVICLLLNVPVSWAEAVAIEAFVNVAKGMGVMVPGALGVQESGVAVMFGLFGLPAPAGLAYAILRRSRDVLYAGVGGGLLWYLWKRSSMRRESVGA